MQILRITSISTLPALSLSIETISNQERVQQRGRASLARDKSRKNPRRVLIAAH